MVKWLQKMGLEWYKELSQEEKDKKTKYVRSRYQNMSEIKAKRT